MTLPPDLAACAASVQAGDPDRFAAVMAAPSGTRARLWPLYALNLELSRAPFASAQPVVAEMRLQWWVDQIARLQAGGRADGDVASALAPVLFAVPAIAPGLSRMAEARRWDCWGEPFADRAALYAHLDATAGDLMWAAALALDAPAAAEGAVRDFARAAGLANWLAAVPVLKARGRMPLPDEAPEAIAALAAEGLSRIARARAARGLVPHHVRPALWSGWSARVRLRAAQTNPARVLQGTLPDPRITRAPALMIRSLTGYW